MDKTHQTINLNDLSHLLFNLVCQSCRLMHSFDNFDHLIWKDQSNPVTQIDYLIQTYLVNSIKHQYGANTIKVIGEEDLTFSDIPQLESIVNDKLKTLQQTQLTSNLQLPKEFSFNHAYNASDLCLWIDPLDCTAGFTNSRQNEVTILVGVSYKGKPIMGIIGHPFQKKEDKVVYEPTVVIGSTQVTIQCAFEYNIVSKEWTALYKPLQSNKKVAVSYRDSCVIQKKVIQTLNLQAERCGGAGYKCLKVIKGDVDSVFLMNQTTSKWDSCAGEAIILSMRGNSINPQLQSIDYSDTEHTSNHKGFFMTTDTTLFHTFTNLIKNIQHNQDLYP